MDVQATLTTEPALLRWRDCRDPSGEDAGEVDAVGKVDAVGRVDAPRSLDDLGEFARSSSLREEEAQPVLMPE